MEHLLKNISQEWLGIIYTKKAKKILDDIMNQLKDEQNITPQIPDIFNWCRYTKLSDIKVVVLGKDPCHKKEYAHGLSFSSLGKSMTPALCNIYKCLVNTNEIETIPTHCNLTSWAEQGVLMLNASLSTIVGTASTHIKIWKSYIRLIIKRICKYNYDNDNSIIFLLWGSFAQSYIDIIDDDYHICLNYIHPSQLDQRVVCGKKFINCKHFKEVNQLLSEDGREPINWAPRFIELDKKEDKKEEVVPEKRYDDAESILDIRPLHHLVYTDGSCYPNNRSAKSRSGYASSFVSGPFKDKCLYGNMDVSKHHASNIRAEGMAIIRTLETIKECSDTWDKVTIVSDCKFWINMLELYMPKWCTAKFKMQSNPDLTLRMWLAYHDVKEKGEVKLLHMRSHNKDGWGNFDEGTFEKFSYDQNDYVDKMCSHARVIMKPTEELFSNIEYDDIN
jgi:uracil-DNA glycosylase